MEDFSRKQLELNSLIEFSQLINTNLNLEFILGNILLSIMGKMLISKGLILLKTNDNHSNDFEIQAAKGIGNNCIGIKINLDIPSDPIFEIKDISDSKFFTDNKIRFFFKIYFIDKLLGILCLGEKLDKSELQKSEILFIETLLNLSSPTIENTIKFNEIKKLNNNLSSQLQHLRTLFELGKEFNSYFQDRDKILRLLKYSLLGNFGIKDYAIFTRFRSDEFTILESGKDIDLDFKIIGNFADVTEPEILSSDSFDDLKKYLYKNGFRLILPITTNNIVETVVCLGDKLNKTEFSVSDIQFLESLINLCVISLDNTVLFSDYVNMQKIENELKIARDIQIALLPKETPVLNNYSLTGCNISALHVGGDYYDYIKLCENKYALVIADVSGKGTPASLLMANIQSAVHSFLKFYDDDFNIKNATQKINELIFSNTSSEKFITFFWGILDMEKNTFTYVNAGHNPPFHFSDGSVNTLNEGGLMLGVIESGIDYSSGAIDLNPDDVLILYTDGVSEAKNCVNDEFSEERIKYVVSENKSLIPSDIQNKLLNEIKTFTSGVNQFDDITMIILKRTS